MAKYTKEKIPFTQVANRVLNDPNLSMNAKGLYGYLFSKPEDWNFSAERIIQDMAESRRTILKYLKELEMVDLLKREKLKTGRVTYNLRYSQKAIVQEATVQNSHSASIAPISKTESESNKETDTAQSAVRKDLVEYYFKETEKKLGFKPEYGGADGAALKRSMTKFTPTEIKDQIDYYLNSKKSTRLGVTLNKVFTPDSINAWKQNGQKQKWI